MQPSFKTLLIALLAAPGCAATVPPAVDQDTDGIGDMADLCPGQPEDGEGPLPDDGCKGVTP
jgi:hypothetical protein